MKDKSIKKNAVYNIIKQCSAILFPMITFSYASHILGISNIGAYSFSQSIVSYFSLFAAMGVSTYSIREGSFIRDDKRKFEKFASELFSLNVIFTILAFIGLLLIIFIYDKMVPYRTWIFILSISVFITTLGVDWINSVYEDFKYLAIRYACIQIISLILMFVFVKNESDLLQYTIISLFAMSGGELFNLFYVRRYAKLRFTFKLHIRRHIFPLLILFGSNFAVIIYVNSDISIITMLLGDSKAGIYAAATKIYQAVKHLMFALITVMIPRFSYLVAKNRNDECDKLMSSTINCLLYFLIPSIVGLFMEGKNIIYIFSGKQYVNGSEALDILCFAIIFACMSNLFNGGVLLPNRQENKVLAISLVACIVNVLLNFILIPRFEINGAAITTLIAEAINGLGALFFSKSMIKLRIDFADILKEIIASIFIILICFVINNMKLAIIIKLCVAILSSCAIYGLITIILKNNIANTAILEIKRKLKGE